MTIVKISEVERLLSCLSPLLVEAHDNGHVGDATVSVPYHVLNDVETLLENVQHEQIDRVAKTIPTWLVDEIARYRGCAKSVASQLVLDGRVDVNNKTVQDPTAYVYTGDLVEVYNKTRQILEPWHVT